MGAAAGLLSLFVLVAPAFANAVDAPPVAGTDVWTFVGPPVAGRLGIIRDIATTFDSHVDTTVLGMVILVVRNNLGQTVYYSTATLTLSRGSYGTAYTVEVGLPPGVCEATVFAFTASGVPISNSTTVRFSA